MIVSLTINPAIDRNIQTDRLVFEDRSYILSRSDSAGGRGINTSRVLQSFGAKTLAIVTSGGKAGSQMEALLAKENFPIEVVRIAHEIRINFTLVDRQGLTLKLNEFGPPISEKELAAIEKTVRAQLANATWLMLCGSIPPGVSSDFYSKLIQFAREKKVKTLLDTDGDALLHGIEAGPTVVMPNQQEAERLLNRALITRQHFSEASVRIKAMGAESVVLSLGSRGVVASDSTQTFEAIPPQIDAISPIGAGDAAAAAFVWAASKKKDFTDCVRWAVAEGTASARLPGMVFATPEQAKEIYRSVTIRKAM